MSSPEVPSSPFLATRIVFKVRTLAERFLISRNLPLLLAVMGAMLLSPSISNGWQVDDLFHRWLLHTCNTPEGLSDSCWDLFNFADGNPARVHRLMDLGVYPWWTLETLQIHFWRPLTVLTHLADERFWPDSAAMMHLVNLFFYALLLAFSTLFFRRLGLPPWVAGLAAFIYAVDSAHAVPVGWIANRNAVLATLFGMLALLSHQHWRAQGSRAGAWASSVFLLLGLLSAEAAIATMAYLFAYALILEAPGWRQRLRSLLPSSLIVLSYLVVYRSLERGAYGSGLYIEPMSEPLRFLAAVALRAPVLLARQWWPISIEGHDFLPLSGQVLSTLTGVALVAPVALLARRTLRQEPLGRFFALGMLVSLVPISATFTMDRLLFFVGIGGAGLLALLLQEATREASLPGSKSGLRLLATLSIFHCVLEPVISPLMAKAVGVFEAVNDAIDAVPEPDGEKGRTVVTIAAPEPYTLGFVPVVRQVSGRPSPDHVRRLASSLVPLTVTRVDAQTLEVEARAGALSWLDGTLVRGATWGMRPHDQVSLKGLTVEVLDVNAQGQPKRALFRFGVPLEDPSLVWLRWNMGLWEPWPPPPLGERLELEARPAHLWRLTQLP